MDSKYKELFNNKEYSFLKTNPLLGNNIILLGLGGSRAYGTDLPTSDIDIRGIATNKLLSGLMIMNIMEKYLNSM